MSDSANDAANDSPDEPAKKPAQDRAAEGSADPLAELTLESATAYDGVFFRVVRDRVRCADGHVGVREFIRHPGAVMIVPLLDTDTLVLERQYRYPLGRSVIEMPAGKLEPGEDPLACAQRELLEETGYRAQRWTRLGAFHNAIGYSDEQIVVYAAQQLSLVGASSEAGEVIEVFTAGRRELLAWIDEGRVTDVKTIVGAYWLERFLSRGAAWS
jgi:ADP-ribose pyrophosphatase